MTETTFHAGVTRRVKSGDGHLDFAINVSGIPVQASDDFIRSAVERAEYTLTVIIEEIDRRIRGQVLSPDLRQVARVNHSAFDAAPVAPAKVAEPVSVAGQSRPTDQRKPVGKLPDDYDPFVFNADGSIPDPSEVRMTGTVFGVEIPIPHFTWCSEPLTKTNNDGFGGGQLKALNTALSEAGYKTTKRHPAALAILQAYGEIHGYEVRSSVDSLNDLSKAEAHIILSFLELADQNALTGLKLAMEVRKQ